MHTTFTRHHHLHEWPNDNRQRMVTLAWHHTQQPTTTKCWGSLVPNCFKPSLNQTKNVQFGSGLGNLGKKPNGLVSSLAILKNTKPFQTQFKPNQTAKNIFFLNYLLAYIIYKKALNLF